MYSTLDNRDIEIVEKCTVKELGVELATYPVMGRSCKKPKTTL